MLNRKIQLKKTIIHLHVLCAVASTHQMIPFKSRTMDNIFPHFLMYSKNYFGQLTIPIAAHFRYTDKHKQGLLSE